MRPQSILTLALLALAACGSPAEPSLASGVAIAPTHAWAGSIVRVTAAAFRNGADGAVLQIGTETLPLSRIDNTTLAATLPSTMSGTFTPRLEAQGQVITLSPVTIGGYVEAFTLQPVLAWDVVVWPRDGGANVMGPSPEGLTLLRLDTRTVTSFDSIIDTDLLRGPGATNQDSIFLLRPRNSATLESWRILPTPERVAVHDMGSSGQSMRLGPNAWFGSSAHSYSTTIRAESSQPYVRTQVQAEETEGVLMSRRHDRATIQVDAAFDGVPVFDVPSGQVAYLI